MNDLAPGIERHHSLPDGGRLVMVHEGVYVYDAEGAEVVSWVIDEWQDDIDTVTATLNCISLVLEHGAAAAKAEATA